MSKVALFPGTFDPFTNGHLNIVNKGLDLFDEVVIAIGVNALKKTMFDLETRTKWIESCFKNEPRVKVTNYSGLTVNFCNEVGANFILRGLRAIGDFEYEKQIAMVNQDLNPEVQSVFVLSEQKYTTVSSTIIRDLIRHGGDYSRYLPDVINIDATRL